MVPEEIPLVVSAELEQRQPFAVALLRTLINTKKNDRHEELRLNR